MATMIGTVADQTSNRVAVHLTAEPRRVGIVAGEECVSILSPEQARELSALLLRAADKADGPTLCSAPDNPSMREPHGS
jgi:hypothetical protein